MSGVQCNSPRWNLWTPNLTHQAITLTRTLTVKSQDDHYYLLCYFLFLLSKMSSYFPLPSSLIQSPPSTSPPVQPKWLQPTVLMRRGWKPQDEVQQYHFPQRNNVLPLVTERKAYKKRNASFISVFVLLILKTRRRKVGHLNINCPDGIEKKTLRPSSLFCVLPSKLLAQTNQSL